MTEGVIITAVLTALVLVIGVAILVDGDNTRLPGDTISTIRCGDGEITLYDGRVMPLPDHLLDDFHNMSFGQFSTSLHRCGVVTYKDLYNFDFRDMDD